MGYYNTATAMVCQVINFPVTMRTTPTLSASSGTDYYRAELNGGTDNFNSFTIVRPHSNGSSLFNSSEVAGTAGQAVQVYSINASASIAFSAEL
jgi:hypothetical protein